MDADGATSIHQTWQRTPSDGLIRLAGRAKPFEFKVPGLRGARCPVKSPLRRSRASGSTRVKVDRAIELGWQPGLLVRDLLRFRRRRSRKDWFDRPPPRFSMLDGKEAA